MSGPGGVCVFSERQDVVLELLTVGRELTSGGTLISFAAGPGAEAAALEQIAHGADEVFVVKSMEGVQAADLHVEALRPIVDGPRTEILLIGATAHGTEVASRLAQRLNVGSASECTELTWRDDELVIERACLGRFVCRQVIVTRPAIATVQPRRFAATDPDPAREGKLHRPTIAAPRSRVSVLETRPREKSGVAIDRADVVVAVGRGLRSKDDLRMIEELARALGGVVGGSRPLTDDLEWLPSDAKVGLSGVTVKPKLYVACGISGQIEHNVGMRESGVVVAINSDPAAPIMRQADYCITGDLHEVVPALIEAVGKLR
jgi:electron transfer flavoprotein alpha subunit